MGDRCDGPVDLDDRETEVPLSRNKLRLFAYIKQLPEVKAQMKSKQNGIEEKHSRRKQVSMPAATATKPTPPKKEEELDEVKMDSILSSGNVSLNTLFYLLKLIKCSTFDTFY